MRHLCGILAAISLVWTGSAVAQDAAKPFKKEELQQLLAPIALYPDQLLAQVLMASTYPLQIVQAARWQKENSKISGDPLEKALGEKDWDPSVKSLVPLPQVLQMMNDKLDWTQKVGDAFLAQQSEVMAEVQYLRAKAQQAGSLNSNKQQTVIKKEEIIVIQPASPQVVYVPVYNPAIVYGAWWYPAYPPYYYPPPSGAAFAAGFYWGAAMAVSAHYWGWGDCDWHRGDIDIDVNRYNEININKNGITSNKWQHNPANRGQVPYRDAASREKFAKQPRPSAPATREARGFDKGGVEERPGGQDRGSRVQEPRDLGNKGAKDVTKAKPAELPKSKMPDRASANDKLANTTSERSSAKSVKSAAPPAFDVQRSADVRAQANRGHASRQSMGAQRGGGGPRSGGGRQR